MTTPLQKALQYTVQNDPCLQGRTDYYTTDITFLQLRNESLTTVPEEIKELSNLETLDLTGNCLTELPEWIGTLTELKSLIVDRNCLETFPISLPPNLTVLSLNNNRVSSFSSLLNTKLARFRIAYNQLTSLPEFPFPSTLETVDLSHNQISTLPDGLEKAESLKLWIMTNNSLTSLPFSLAQLPLHRLVLNHNHFERFPEVIERMRLLVHLEIAHNQITEIPQSLQLRSLTINGNPCSLPMDTQIGYIDVRDCLSLRA
ncbi:MAG: hypothetical protein KDK96_08630 [Chlamydiia bacterium]|nr:hypothetical protein [Chlamydiia bacterium]